MPEPDPAAYRTCLTDAQQALGLAISLLTAAAMHARDADDRASAIAPISGLELARDHVGMLIALATN